jgi:hypothetical protein
MSKRLMSVVVLALVGVFAFATPAFAASYSTRISQYVAARPAQARIVQMALIRAGWADDTPAQRALLRQAILVSAGESGMNPVNNGNPSCSGLFQIYNGKKAYGTWTAAELASPATRSHYTLTERPWRFGKVMKYTNGEFLRWDNGWYQKPGTVGNKASDYAYGKIKVYTNSSPIGWGYGYYQGAEVSYYAPKVGEYKIFNPVFNAEVARKMFASRGWQPWTVARKLGY